MQASPQYYFKTSAGINTGKGDSKLSFYLEIQSP